MLIGHKSIGYVACGSDFMRNLPYSIAFGFWRRRDCPLGEIAWRLSGHFSWVLPCRYVRVAPPAFVPGSSAAWTGREYRFDGFDWSSFYKSYSLQWIGGAA